MKSKKLSMFPLMIDKWIAGTRHMTYEEKGMYLDMLLYMFTERKPIKDGRHAANILHLTGHSASKCLSILQDKCHANQSGYFHPFVNRLLNNDGKIKGLGSVADSAAITGAEGGEVPSKDKDKEYTDTTYLADKPPNEFDIWKIWREFLQAKSVPQSQAGILAKVINQHGEEKAKQGVLETIAKNPADPISYIGGIMKPKRRTVVV
jgi:uncharacterized protein YdaU (DUF1376 family)